MVLLAAPVSAQEDPYGSTTTTSVPRGERPSCQLRTRTLTPGGRATVTVRRVLRDTTVRVLFDGTEVARAEATGPGNSERVNIDITFTVPDDASSGRHEITAVGVDFAASCRGQQDDGAEVLGVEIERGSGGGGSSSLPRTGVVVALLLAIAIALIIVGRAILGASRRRRGRVDPAPSRSRPPRQRVRAGR